MRIILHTICAIALVLIISGSNIKAQSVWLYPEMRSSFSVEAYRLDRGWFAIVPNGTALFLNLRILNQSGLSYLFEIPFVRSDKIVSKFFGELESQAVTGNPYFGFSYRDNDTNSVTYDVGIRLPLAKVNNRHARTIGISTDFDKWVAIDFDRWEAFASDRYSLRALFGRFWSIKTSPHYGWIKGGATLIIPHQGEAVELLANFQAGIWFKGDVSVFGANLIGQTLITERGLNLTQRSEFVYGFGYTLKLGNFRPGIHVRVPVIPNGLFHLGEKSRAAIGFSMTKYFGEEKDKEKK